MEREDVALDVLEKKIASLERLLYGETFKSSEGSTTVIEDLLAANIILNAAGNGRQNIGAVFKRLEELNSNLSDEVLAERKGDIERKQDIIINLQEDYEASCAALNKLKGLYSALDQGNLKSIEESRLQLDALINEYATITSNIGNSSASSNVLSVWKTLVMETSRGLAAANSLLTEVEAKKLGLNDSSNRD